jgi:hypothetical protein
MLEKSIKSVRDARRAPILGASKQGDSIAKKRFGISGGGCLPPSNFHTRHGA